MKSILRNFLTTLQRFKLASLLNILGLAVALAAFILILMQLRYEVSFDKFHAKTDRIFRLEGSGFYEDSPYASVVHNRPAIEEFIRSSPHIEAAAPLFISGKEIYYAVGEPGHERGFKSMFVPCYPDITRIFDFNLVAGNASALHDPGKVLIPNSLAHLLFGRNDVVGEMIHTRERPTSYSDHSDLEIGGVYEDFPRNSQLNNAIYFRMNDHQATSTGRNFQLYVLLDDPANKQAVVENFVKNYYKDGRNYSKEYRLTNMADIYYTRVENDDMQKLGNKNVTMTLLAIALLIIVIAAINFTNFSTSLAPMRIKSINTQKILGNPASVIRRQLVFEAVGIAAIAYLCAVYIVYMLSLTSFIELLSADFHFGKNAGLLAAVFGTSLLIGIIAGIYPAYYMTSFRPAMVLTGSFGLSPKGRKLRTGLIGMQYIVSIALIISALFVKLQSHYLTHSDMGFEQDNIAVVNIGRALYANHQKTYADRLKQYAGIEEVAFSDAPLAGQESYSGDGLTCNGEDILFQVFEVSDNFLDVMKIPVLEGRNFSPSDELREKTLTYIFNEEAQRQYGFKPMRMNRYKDEAEVVGIMGDIHVSSLRQTVGPLAFVITGQNTGYHKQARPVSYVKIKAGANIHEAVGHIKKVVHSLDPAYPLEVTFFDRMLDHMYRQEIKFSRLITLFTLLAVVISLIGVFGLVVFETQYRRKEIGIRKVFGATVNEILTSFNKTYVTIVLVCFIPAVPIAYHLVHGWLNHFAYKTPMYLWVYLLALLIILTITVGVVTMQSYRAATENPAEAIKAG